MLLTNNEDNDMKLKTLTYLGALSTCRLNHLINQSSLSVIHQRSHVNSLVETVTDPQLRHSQL